MKFKRATLVGLTAILVLGGMAYARIYVNQRLEEAMLAVKEEKYSEAIDRASLLAKLGNSDAQHLLGELYAFGWGVSKNDEAATELFRRAGIWASPGVQPEAPAEFFVGERYEKGTGIEPNLKEALEWYRRSAAGGYVQAKERVRALESGR